MGGLVQFLTSKTGVVAAVSVALVIIVAFIATVRPLNQLMRARPAVRIYRVTLSSVSPYSRKCELRFFVGNSRDSKAIVSAMRLRVITESPTTARRSTKTGAPVPVHQYRVEFIANRQHYELLRKMFGPSHPPIILGPGETEAVLTTIVSRRPMTYKFCIEVEWTSTRSPENLRTVRSEPLTVTFPVDQNDTV